MSYLLRRSGVETVAFFLAVSVITAFTAWLLRYPQEGVFGCIKGIAVWLNGGQMPEVVTWPAWGYAWVIALIPSLNLVIVLQACLGVLALTLLAKKLWSDMPGQRTVLTVLLLLAIPWYTLQVTLYPSALAGSLALLALISFNRALINNDMRWALMAGALMGLAQNFRTEFVLLSVFLGISVVGLKRFDILKIPSLKPVWVFIITALILQLPWAGFYYAQTGRFSLTESNFGHVMYVSLGSHPNNPWGISGDDQAAGEAVRRQGYACSSLSEQGNKVLLRLVRQDVMMHPYGVIQGNVQRLKNMLLAPFSWGEPNLDEKGTLDLDVLREELKCRLGVAVNVRKLKNHRIRGLYPDAIKNRAAVIALLYQIVTVGLGSLVLLLGMTGMILVAFQLHPRPPTPLLYLLGCAAIYKMLLNVLLCYQVNYLNNVYPVFVPFVSISLAVIVNRFRHCEVNI